MAFQAIATGTVGQLLYKAGTGPPLPIADIHADFVPTGGSWGNPVASWLPQPPASRLNRSRKVPDRIGRGPGVVPSMHYGGDPLKSTHPSRLNHLRGNQGRRRDDGGGRNITGCCRSRASYHGESESRGKREQEQAVDRALPWADSVPLRLPTRGPSLNSEMRAAGLHASAESLDARGIISSLPAIRPPRGGAMGAHNVAPKGRSPYICKTGETSENARKANLARVFVSVGEWRYLSLIDVRGAKCPHKARVPGSRPGGPTKTDEGFMRAPPPRGPDWIFRSTRAFRPCTQGSILPQASTEWRREVCKFSTTAIRSETSRYPLASPGSPDTARPRERSYEWPTSSKSS